MCACQLKEKAKPMAAVVTDPLEKYQVLHLLEKKPCITISNKVTIGEVVKLLSEKRIRSVPVIDEETKKCLGSVNVLDIAGYTAHLDIGEEEIRGAAIFYFEKPITDVLNHYKTDYFVPMYPSFPLKQVVHTLCRLAHCVPISDENGKILSVITQSDVLRFISKNVHVFLGKNATRMPSEVGLVKGFDNVLKIDVKSSVLKAVTTIYEKRVSALAIVNDIGTLIGNFSASDLRDLTVDNFSKKIKDPIYKFISLEHQELVAVSESTSIGNIIKVLVEKKVHRVWIIDADEKPVGLVALSDIMMLVKSGPAN